MAGSCRSPTLARRGGGGRAGARGARHANRVGHGSFAESGRADFVDAVEAVALGGQLVPGRQLDVGSRLGKEAHSVSKGAGVDVDNPADPIWLAIDDTLHHRAAATVAHQYDVALERGDQLGHGGDVVVEGCTGGRSFSQTRKSDGMGGQASSAQAGSTASQAQAPSQ